MNPTQETAIETSAGMETATQTVDRVKSALAQPVNASNVPVSVLSTPTPDLQMPPVPTIQPDMGVVGEGQTLLDQETARAQAAANQATQNVSDSERQVRELFGMTQTEGQTRTQLEEQAGVNAFSQDLRKFQESLRRQVAELDQFDINNVNTIEQMRVDAGKRDITKRTFGAMSAEANIQMAVRRANMVASTRATIAAIDVTQGNLQAATEQVDKALKAVYEPVRQQLQMEMFFLERNDRRFDAAQKDLAQTRMMQIQREQAEIDRAIAMVDAAVATGIATPGEVQELVGIQDPIEQANAARDILGRSAAEQRWYTNTMNDLQMRNIRDQIDARNMSFIQTLESDTAEADDKRRAVTEKSLQIKTLANELISDPGLRTAVGPNKLARIGGGWTGKDARFIAKAERMIALITGDNLELMRGTLTDKDIEILQDMGTTLAAYQRQNWAVREKDVVDELQRLATNADRIITNNSLSSEQAVFWGIATPDDVDTFKTIWSDETLTSPDFNASQYFQ